MQAEKVGYMEAKRDTDMFLAAHARQLQHCPRMHLTALRLPCGEREECVAGSRCKEFCRRHGICENTVGQHMRGDMRISPYMLRQYERKLGIPRKELEDATALSARGISSSKRFW